MQFDFLKSFRTNVDELQAAYFASTATDGYVYVWPQYWLAAKISRSDCQAVRVDRATVVNHTDIRIITNGHGQKAVLINRQEALRGALKNAREILENFAANMEQAR